MFQQLFLDDLRDLNFRVKSERPEDLFTEPEDYFNDFEFRKYVNSKSIRRTQQKLCSELFYLINEFYNVKSPVLDAGCGPGFTIEFLIQNGFKVVGVDRTSEMVKWCKAKGLDVFEGDFTELPFKKNEFNCVISVSAFQWVKDKLSVVEELSRVLMSTGLIGLQFYPRDNNELIEWFKILKRFFDVKLFVVEPKNPIKRRFYFIGEKLVK